MLDLLAIRDRLNAQPFEQGRRRTPLGKIWDYIDPPPAEEQQEEPSDADAEQEDTTAAEAGEPPEDPPEVRELLDALGRELETHGLRLERGERDPDHLYAVQEIEIDMTYDLSGMAEAMRWVSKVTTVALEMVVPGVVGLWLDRQLGTGYLGLIGFAIGVPLAIWHLIKMTRPRD